MSIYETAVAGTPVRVRILSGPFAPQTGTLTLYDISSKSKRLFVITFNDGAQAFLRPDSYELEPIGEDN